MQSTDADVIILKQLITGQSCGTSTGSHVHNVCLCVLLHNPSFPQAVNALKGVSNQHCSKKSHINIQPSARSLYLLRRKKTELKKKSSKISEKIWKWKNKIWNCKNKDLNLKKTNNKNTSNIIISKVQTYNWLQYHPFFFSKCETHKAPHTCWLLLSSDANTFDCPLVERCWRAHHIEEIRTITITQNHVFVGCCFFFIQTVSI